MSSGVSAPAPGSNVCGSRDRGVDTSANCNYFSDLGYTNAAKKSLHESHITETMRLLLHRVRMCLSNPEKVSE